MRQLAAVRRPLFCNREAVRESYLKTQPKLALRGAQPWLTTCACLRKISKRQTLHAEVFTPYSPLLRLQGVLKTVEWLLLSAKLHLGIKSSGQQIFLGASSSLPKKLRDELHLAAFPVSLPVVLRLLLVTSRRFRSAREPRGASRPFTRSRAK